MKVLTWYLLATLNIFYVNTQSKLIKDIGKIFCESRVQVLHVYFENETSIGNAGRILREVSNCGISYISIRNTFKTSPLEVIKDDGILMYLLMILNDVSLPLEPAIIKKKSAAKHLSHVILLIMNPNTITKSWLRNTFRRFWQLWVLNVVIIYRQGELLQINRYNPFADTYLIKIPYKEQLPKLNDLFPKIVPNMHRKPLRMCIYPDETRATFDDRGNVFGTDGLMSTYIAERLNATRVIDRSHPYGNFSISADICFMEIENEFDDIAMNIRFLSLESFMKRVEPTFAHNRDDMCVIVPKAHVASSFWNLFHSFGNFVWAYLLLSILFANIFCAISYRGHLFLKKLPLQLFASTTSQPVVYIPRVSSLRLFLIFWIYFCMLIGTAFKGNLTSMLASHKNLPDVNTLRDLALSPYEILVRPRHVKHIVRFLNVQNSIEATLKRKLKTVPDWVLFDHFNKNNLSFGYMEKFHVASFQTNARKHIHIGHPLFHLMDTCLVPFHAVYIVPYGSPYLGFINFLIRSSHEFGFERYWDHIMNASFIKSGTTVAKNRKSSTEDPVVLTLHHFEAIFCLWATGVLLANLVFLCEIICKPNRKRRANFQYAQA